jgi:hypothetical protein
VQDGEPAGAADAQDGGQRVWLHLVEHLGGLRDTAAPPGWLATATRRECARLCEAFTSLPPRYQQLITLLIHDPPMPYSQISAALGVPVDSPIEGPGTGDCRASRNHPEDLKRRLAG